MHLTEALSILSKSSPYAVSTERQQNQRFGDLKDYLYIKTEIEKDFEEKINNIQPGDIIFLCGSSGDGKSEILTHYSKQKKYSEIDFHLDATHSFQPDQTAIDALDDRFLETIQTQNPLVMGINIGILGNYSKEGADECDLIKCSINAFIDEKNDDIPKGHYYLNFESYPKFKFHESYRTSDFSKSIISKLTAPSEENPFYSLLKNELTQQGHSYLTTNFQLLSLPEVQDSIIEILLKARLVKDQFLTARTLLDFVYQLLVGNKYLFDTLFSGGDNELLERINQFDPVYLRSKAIDQFILKFDLKIKDKNLEQFKIELEEYGIYALNSSCSYIRLSSLLGKSELGSDFRQSLNGIFQDREINEYAINWRLHKYFDGTSSQKQTLNKFYRDILISSIHKYANRNASELAKDEYFLGEYNGFKVASELKIKPNFTAIEVNDVEKLGYFNAYLIVENQEISVIPISTNLLELMLKINEGYRPNKHDKNTILLLDEVIEQIISIAKESNTLYIVNKNKRFKVVNEDHEYFEVSGI